MRMISRRIATPRVKYAEESELDILQALRRGAHVTDALTASVEQAAIAVSLERAQHQPYLPGHRKRDQEVMNRH